MASGEESAMVAGEESAMVATREKRNYPRSKKPRKKKLSKKEQYYPTDPNKSWKEPKWQLTFDPPQPSTTFQAASKKDLRLAGWQLGKKRPAELFPLMYDQHGDPVRCVECGMKWLSGKATGKRHNYDGFVLDSEGNKVPICVIARQKGNSAKRPKSNPAQSAAKQQQQSSNVVPVSGPASLPASEPASEPASLPAPDPASVPSPKQQLLENDEECEAIRTLASILVDPHQASPRSSPRSENRSWNSLSEFVMGQEFDPSNPGISLDAMCGL